MRSTIIFNGKSSRDFGLTVEHLPESRHGARRGEIYQLAGRNGSRVQEDGTFENYDQPYEVWFHDFLGKRDVYALSRDIAAWLLGSRGYCRLEDTYEPEHFRLARFAGPFDAKAVLRRCGRAVLEFDCQPERYLKIGENAVTVLSGVSMQQTPQSFVLRNPTGATALPLLRLTVNGSVGFEMISDAGTFTVKATASTPKTILFDCNSYAVTYADGTDASAAVQYRDARDYPMLPALSAGDTTIRSLMLQDSGTIELLEIIPRWWTP